MNTNQIQTLIDNTDYWDMEVLELNISFFGDEVTIIVDNDDENAWKISFLPCFKVSYQTDVMERRIQFVREMNQTQLGYYAQDITVSEGNTEGLYRVHIDLSIMEMEIECKGVSVELISKINI